MDVNLSDELQAKLVRIAQVRGVDVEALVHEGIKRLVDYDDWFGREVERGLAQIERGDTLSHEETGARLREHLAGKPTRL